MYFNHSAGSVKGKHLHTIHMDGESLRASLVLGAPPNYFPNPCFFAES